MLEFRLAGFNVTEERIRNTQEPTKFVAEALDCVVSVYVGPENKHDDVARSFNLETGWETRIVGGGRFFVDRSNTLYVGGESLSFGPLPRKAADEVSRLIHAKLSEQGISIRTVRNMLPEYEKLSQFWRHWTGYNTV